MEITLSQTINAPRQRVFECIYDDSNLKKWVPEFQGNIYPDGFDKNNPTGKPFTHILKEGGRTTNYTGEIITYSPPEKLVMTITGKSFAMEITYNLVEVTENQTRLDYSVTSTFKNGFIKFIGKVFAGLTKKIVNKQIARLTALAEGGE